jgi:hypothetical protein
MALATTRKGNSTITEYIAKMQALGNDMAATGKPLDDEDLIQYILPGLDEDFNSVVNSVLARPQAITVAELAAQMLTFESYVDIAVVALARLRISQGVEVAVASTTALDAGAPGMEVAHQEVGAANKA